MPRTRLYRLEIRRIDSLCHQESRILIASKRTTQTRRSRRRILVRLGVHGASVVRRKRRGIRLEIPMTCRTQALIAGLAIAFAYATGIVVGAQEGGGPGKTSVAGCSPVSRDFWPCAKAK